MKNESSVFPIYVLGFSTYACCVAPLLAFLLAGAGHGWLSPIWVSWASVVSCPALPLWWVCRRRRWGPAVGLALLAVWCAADAALSLWSWQEREYFDKVWLLNPAFLIAWAVAWSLPQFGLAALLVASRKGSPPEEGDGGKTATIRRPHGHSSAW